MKKFIMLVLALIPLTCFAPEISNEQKKSEIWEIITGRHIIEKIKTRLIIDINGSTPIYSPIRVNEIKRVSDLYGWRVHPISKVVTLHHGIDFAIPTGTDILVTADGKVSRSGWRSGYGNQITINHGYGFKTRYAHLSKINVKKGDKVECGDIIGISGNTGISTGPHLHYEIVRNGRPIDPMKLVISEPSRKNIKLYLDSLAELQKIAWLKHKSNVGT